MIDIKAFRENPKIYADSAKKRGSTVDVELLVKLDQEYMELLATVETLRAELNLKDKPTAEQLVKLQKTKVELESKETKLKAVAGRRQELLEKIPNLLSLDVPVGKDESENKPIKKVGTPTKFDFKPKEHWELGEALGLIDNERASEVSGARFTYLKGGIAKLQFSLIQFVVKNLTDPEVIEKIVKEAGLKVSTKPFVMVVPPVMIRPNVMQKMARLEPREERYHIEGDDLYLVGSAEHTLGPLHMGEVLAERICQSGI